MFPVSLDMYWLHLAWKRNPQESLSSKGAVPYLSLSQVQLNILDSIVCPMNVVDTASNQRTAFKGCVKGHWDSSGYKGTETSKNWNIKDTQILSFEVTITFHPSQSKSYTLVLYSLASWNKHSKKIIQLHIKWKLISNTWVYVDLQFLNKMYEGASLWLS